ncbi:MAG: hypothetical protein MUO55_05315 [Candidatus Atribacteria bacterium]|nr:hypothetical protein [Candidatus Atribacteria bacterium]
MFGKLISSLLIIFIGLISGYIVQILVQRNILRLPFGLEKIRKYLQKFSIFFFITVIYIGVYWSMDFHQLKLFLFPLLGIFNLFLGGGIAVLVAGLTHMNDKDTGSFFCCGFFTNYVGTGGLICFLFLGEGGYALLPIYTFFIRIAYYMVGFPVAKYYSIKGNQQNQKAFNFKLIMKDSFVLFALAAVIIGLSLNASGIERPAIYTPLISFFIPAHTIILLFSIGLSMKFNKIRKYLKAALLISGIKYLIVPLTMVSIGFLLGYQHINDGLPLKVILILSSGPVAFHSLIPPSQYELNLDLANSCWIITTFSLVLLIPVISFLIHLI